MGKVLRVQGMSCSAPLMDMVQDVTVGAWVLSEVREFKRPTVCLFNGEPLLRAEWDETMIGSEDVCVFATLPQSGGGGGGGGSNPLQAVIMVATIALVAVAAPYLAGGALSMMSGGTFAAGAEIASLGYGAAAFGAGAWGVATAIAGGAIALTTGALLNAVLPSPRTPSALSNSQTVGTANAPEAASPTYSVQAQGNSARLLQSIPEGFGRNRHWPDMISQPYWEFDGNQQYIYQLLCLGQGHYRIEAVLIENTEVWRNGSYTGNFEDITLEFVSPNGEVTLFPDNVATSSEISGQELSGDWAGPFVASAADTEANYLAVDLVMQRGLYHWGDNNLLEDFSLGYEVHARRIDNDRNPLGDWIVLGSGTITMADNTAQRISYRYAVTPGRYEVRARRTTEKSTSTRDGNDLAWGGLRAYLPSTRTYGGVTTIAVRARATNNLSSMSSRKFNVIAERLLPTWSPVTRSWSDPVPTRSLAWALAAQVRQKWGGDLPDSRLDLDQLARMDEIWTERGDEFNAIIDSADTVWGVLTSSARAGRAKPLLVAGNVMFLRDEPQAVVAGVFTPQNIVRGSFDVDFALYDEDSPDDVVIEYFDTERWKWDEVPCTLEGSESEKPARKKILGVSSRAHAYREGMYEAACNDRRRIFPHFTTALDGRIVLPGQLVSVSHPLPGWGHAGCVSRIITEEPLTLGLTDPVEWTSGETHYLALRRRDGKMWGPCKALPGANARQIVLDDVDLNQVVVETGDDPLNWIYTGRKMERTAYQFGPESRWGMRCLVVSVTPRGLDRVELACVNEDPAVHTADQGSMPPAPPTSNLPGVTDGPVVTGLRATQGGTADAPVLNLAWAAAPGAENYIVQTSANERDWTTATVTDCSISLTSPVGMIYARVAGMGRVRGPWATWSGMVGGADVPPAPVAEVTLTQPSTGGDALIQWPQSLLATSYVVQIWRAGVKMREVVQAGIQYSYSRAIAEQDGGPWRSYEVRIIARNSHGDAAAATLAVSDPAPAVPANILASKTASSITLTWDAETGDVAGYLVGRGSTSTFTPAQAVEMRVATGTSITFYGLPADTDHYFRVAARDLYYTRYPALADLNISDVITVRTNP